MKKSLAFSILMSVILLTSIMAVSASVTSAPATTIIAGKIYDGPNFETANGVQGANINVTCNQYLLQTISLDDGTYSVKFSDNTCPDNSNVTVIAEKGGITNSGTGKVHDYTAIMPDLYLGVVNIALIPEFGAFVGGLTLVSAIGVFFLVRRK
jgi:hypothetical protein